MTTEKLQEFHAARPFRPFRLHLADGRKLDVRHPEIMAYTPNGRTLLYVHPDDRAERVDLLLVVSLEELPARSKGRRRKAG
jgi:hypothetical protein